MCWRAALNAADPSEAALSEAGTFLLVGKDSDGVDASFKSLWQLKTQQVKPVATTSVKSSHFLPDRKTLWLVKV